MACQICGSAGHDGVIQRHIYGGIATFQPCIQEGTYPKCAKCPECNMWFTDFYNSLKHFRELHGPVEITEAGS